MSGAPTPLEAALKCRCPGCGRGRLYRGLLSVVPKCGECGLDLASHDAGDGPTVFVILILGAVVVGLAFLLQRFVSLHPIVQLAIWTPVIVGGAILMLRHLKALLIALQYRHRSLG